MSEKKKQTGWRGSFASIPAVGLALLPNITCPACWPAYAGLLTALGVPVLMNTSVLLPLTVLFLTVAVGSMAFRAKQRRGFGPLGVGVVAAVMVISGKFVFAIDGLAYAGIALLVTASFWNSRPRGQSAKGSCSARAQTDNLNQLEHH